MDKKSIIKFLKTNGKVGSTSTERYIDIYEVVKVKRLTLEQLVWFGDIHVLSAYFLNKHNEGTFIDYDDLDKETKKKIRNLTIWQGDTDKKAEDTDTDDDEVFLDRNRKPLKVGSHVLWYDPEKEARDLSRVWTVYNMCGDIVYIHTDDRYHSEAEVFPEELKIVTK